MHSNQQESHLLILQQMVELLLLVLLIKRLIAVLRLGDIPCGLS